MATKKQLEILKQGVEVWNDRGGGRLDLSHGQAGSVAPSVERMICLALTLRIRSLNFPNLVDFVNLIAILYLYEVMTH